MTGESRAGRQRRDPAARGPGSGRDRAGIGPGSGGDRRAGRAGRLANMADLRIALAQIDTCVGDLEGNADAVLAWSRRAAEAGADLVAFPEMTLTGYPIEDLALRGSFRRAAWDAAADVASRLAQEGLGGLTVVLGTVGSAGEGRALVGEDHGLPTNRAVVIADGAVVASYDKQHLPNYGVFDEFRIFEPGSEPRTVEVGGRTIGLLVCEDIWQDGPVAAVADLGCDLLLVLNGSPYEEGKEAPAPTSSRAAPPRSTRPSPTSTWSAARTTSSSTAVRS
ncbi:hypothetical protein GCM10025865_25780 [Paraoerskovia sediminicola]|uniref:CN hydrolase domain-containing protein n=1 Tax=Paraoerskovia sediminicola TaxID=1138587 RepID=A0ABN6XEM8_9CELL|nr:hypothetical protein GCM10025865_25780 [Paraoerskovia sediminicola]